MRKDKRQTNKPKFLNNTQHSAALLKLITQSHAKQRENNVNRVSEDKRQSERNKPNKTNPQNRNNDINKNEPNRRNLKASANNPSTANKISIKEGFSNYKKSPPQPSPPPTRKEHISKPKVLSKAKIDSSDTKRKQIEGERVSEPLKNKERSTKRKCDEMQAPSTHKKVEEGGRGSPEKVTEKKQEKQEKQEKRKRVISSSKTRQQLDKLKKRNGTTVLEKMNFEKCEFGVGDIENVHITVKKDKCRLLYGGVEAEWISSRTLRVNNENCDILQFIDYVHKKINNGKNTDDNIYRDVYVYDLEENKAKRLGTLLKEAKEEKRVAKEEKKSFLQEKDDKELVTSSVHGNDFRVTLTFDGRLFGNNQGESMKLRTSESNLSIDFVPQMPQINTHQPPNLILQPPTPNQILPGSFSIGGMFTPNYPHNFPHQNNLIQVPLQPPLLQPLVQSQPMVQPKSPQQVCTNNPAPFDFFSPIEQQEQKK